MLILNSFVHNGRCVLSKLLDTPL